MVLLSWDWYVLYNGHRNVCFGHGWGQSWHGPFPLLIPRLSDFGLIWAIPSISTLPLSHHEYDQWFCKDKIKIWIHHPQPTPHPRLWVLGGDDDDFGSRTLRFTPRWSVFGLIQLCRDFSKWILTFKKITDLKKLGFLRGQECVSIGKTKSGILLLHLLSQVWSGFYNYKPITSVPLSATIHWEC